MILFLFVAMAFFAIPHWLTGTVAHPPLALSIPAFTLLNFNILGKMGFGALGGFDSAGDLRRRMPRQECSPSPSAVRCGSRLR